MGGWSGPPTHRHTASSDEIGGYKMHPIKQKKRKKTHFVIHAVVRGQPHTHALVAGSTTQRIEPAQHSVEFVVESGGHRRRRRVRVLQVIGGREVVKSGHMRVVAQVVLHQTSGKLKHVNADVRVINGRRRKRMQNRLQVFGGGIGFAADKALQIALSIGRISVCLFHRQHKRRGGGGRRRSGGVIGVRQTHTQQRAQLLFGSQNCDLRKEMNYFTEN